MLRRGALLFPFLVLFAGASLIREAAVGILTRAEEHWEGFLMGQATAPGAAGPTTLIEIGDDTTLKHVWPWTAQDFAVFFHAAIPFDPEAIGVEPVLDADRGALAGGEREEIYEKMLHEGILRAPKLVLGGTLGYAPDAETAPTKLKEVLVLPKIRGDLSKVPNFTAVEAWAEERFRLSTKPGWTNLPDDLGPLGRCPLVLRYFGQPVPTMTLQLAMMWEKVTSDEVEIVLGSHIQLGKKRIPIDEAGRMVVNFGVRYERVSYDDLLLTREQLDKKEAPMIPAANFTNRVLLLGRTDGFMRNIATPSGKKATPSEVVAAGLATIQSGAHPHRLPAWADWLFVAVVAIACLWLPRSKATPLALIVIVSEAALVAAAVLLYRSQTLVLPGVLPLGLALWILLLRAVAKRAQRVIAF